HLIRDVRWRALASGVGAADPARAAGAQTRATTLLGELVTELGRVDAVSLLQQASVRTRESQQVDLRRDWVAALSHLGQADGTDVARKEVRVGRQLWERLLVGFENPACIEGICQFEVDGARDDDFHLVLTSDELRYVEGRSDQATAWVRMSAATARE